ncbi:hypothetical protein CVS40_3181 [Lucilia cuprina]|nr:hypothetical protein CVS40_3181 [Lucilia cuprina]
MTLRLPNQPQKKPANCTKTQHKLKANQQKPAAVIAKTKTTISKSTAEVASQQPTTQTAATTTPTATTPQQKANYSSNREKAATPQPTVQQQQPQKLVLHNQLVNTRKQKACSPQQPGTNQKPARLNQPVKQQKSGTPQPADQQPKANTPQPATPATKRPVPHNQLLNKGKRVRAQQSSQPTGQQQKHIPHKPAVQPQKAGTPQP